MLYDWLFITIGLILTIGFAIYISRENYTKADIGNIIMLDEEGIPNVVDRDEANQWIDNNFNAIKTALQGGSRVSFTLAEVQGNPDRAPGSTCPKNTIRYSLRGRDKCVYAVNRRLPGYNFNVK